MRKKSDREQKGVVRTWLGNELSTQWAILGAGTPLDSSVAHCVCERLNVAVQLCGRGRVGRLASVGSLLRASACYLHCRKKTHSRLPS